MKKSTIQFKAQYWINPEEASFRLYPMYKKCNFGVIPHYIFRVIRADECPEKGIACTNFKANIDYQKHISGGYKQSQLISTTACFTTASAWAQKDQCRIVVIDTTLLLSTILQNKRSGEGLKGRHQNFAKSSQEILYEKVIPANAIVKTISVEEINQLMVFSGEFESYNTQMSFRNLAKNRARNEMISTCSTIEYLAQETDTWTSDFLNTGLFSYSNKFWNQEACAHIVVAKKQ